MLEEKSGIPQATRTRYTQLREGDVLLGPTRAYLVVRRGREGTVLTYLALIGEEGRPLVVVRSALDIPVDPCWEVIKRP